MYNIKTALDTKTLKYIGIPITKIMNVINLYNKIIFRVNRKLKV